MIASFIDYVINYGLEHGTLLKLYILDRIACLMLIYILNQEMHPPSKLFLKKSIMENQKMY